MITTIDDYNIRAHNTFRMDVQTRHWIEYTEAADLPKVFIEMDGDEFRSIGEGSNMLFMEDYEGTLLHSRILDLELSASSDGKFYMLRIGSGVKLDDVINQLAQAGIWGLENLSYIPGTAGSAAVQNVGAYGVEICEYVDSVECYDRTMGMFVGLTSGQCRFGYRDSIFKRPENRSRYVVTHLNLKLPRNAGPRLDYGHLRKAIAQDTPSPMEVREAVIEIRRQKLPDVESVGSAGSFFKNPVLSPDDFYELQKKCDIDVPHYTTESGVKVPAAWLIDQCGFKGRSYKGVSVWEKQPLVIVNTDGKASPTDVIELERMICEEVWKRFNIMLTPEVDHISNY